MSPPPKNDWLEVNLPWRVGIVSFRRHPACRSGTYIEMKKGDTGNIVKYLIGDINELGGGCDDYLAIRDNDTVLRYKRIKYE